MFRKPIIQNDLFVGIMGKTEFEKFQLTLTLDVREGIALISISEPDNDVRISEDSAKTVGFHDVLEMKFWDVEKEIDGYTPITKEQGKIIKDFIIKNIDKKFLIHCKAGISRSAGVGKAVECLVKFNGDPYAYMTSHSDIQDYSRYKPNMTVFDCIVK